MRIYSDKLNKLFDTVEECEKAELEAQKKEEAEKIRKEQELALAKEKKEKAVAERKALANEVETARKAYLKAQKEFREKLEGFCSKYGTYHYTVENGEEIPNLFDMFTNLFKF